jgi:uncharacterized repeat protein (TIGR04076 family)
MTDDNFELYDLRVEVIETGKPFVMHAKPGDTFDVIGGRIVFPPGREPSFSLYAMLAVLPFIPAKQRPTHPNDWMTTDTEIASPDPHCGARIRITRLGTRTLRHADYSAISKGASTALSEPPPRTESRRQSRRSNAANSAARDQAAVRSLPRRGRISRS